MAQVADLLHQALSAGDDAALEQVRNEVRDLCQQFPLPHATIACVICRSAPARSQARIRSKATAVITDPRTV
jgi:hypothetical protein